MGRGSRRDGIDILPGWWDCDLSRSCFVELSHESTIIEARGTSSDYNCGWDYRSSAIQRSKSFEPICRWDRLVDSKSSYNSTQPCRHLWTQTPSLTTITSRDVTIHRASTSQNPVSHA